MIITPNDITTGWIAIFCVILFVLWMTGHLI
jgi:hypothetical protein